MLYFSICVCLLLKHIVNYKFEISLEKEKKKCIRFVVYEFFFLGHTKVGNKCPLSKESVKNTSNQSIRLDS